MKNKQEYQNLWLLLFWVFFILLIGFAMITMLLAMKMSGMALSLAPIEPILAHISTSALMIVGIFGILITLVGLVTTIEAIN